jgi:hypothetical protein
MGHTHRTLRRWWVAQAACIYALVVHRECTHACSLCTRISRRRAAQYIVMWQWSRPTPMYLRPVNLCESEYVHSECRRDSKCDSKCIRGSESESTCKHVRASVCV